MAFPTIGTIAVMGITGSGKSSFINGITGDIGAKVGRSLRSETSDIQTFRLQTPSGIIYLADTPGFDDTERQDYEVLEQIVDWVKKSFVNGKGLTAIVLLHPITHNRLQGSSRRMFSTFKKLLGDDYFKKVLLVTTFWNSIQIEIGKRRERELIESADGWKHIIDPGAKLERVGGDYKRFIPILERISKGPAPEILALKELAEGKVLSQTMAGLSLQVEGADQNERLRKLKVRMDTEAAMKTDRFKETMKWQKSMNSLVYEKEMKKHDLANKEIIAQMKMEEERRAAIRKQKLRELQEQQRIQREMQREVEKKKKDEERKQLKRGYEVIAKLQHKASIQLQEQACEVTDLIRAYSATGILPVSINGIQQEGIGFF